MAIIVSQSLASSHPLDHDATKAVGVVLPLVKGNSGYFQQSYTTAEAIYYDLVNLLLTHRKERPLNPGFGSRLQEILFEQNNENLEFAIDNSIRDTISQYMGFVEVDNVEVIRESDPDNIYAVVVKITYHVPNIVGQTDLVLQASI